MGTKREISLKYILLILLFLFLSMFYTLKVLESNIIQIPMILTGILAAIIAYFHGYNWAEIKFGMLTGVNTAIEGVIILLIIGMLIASWIAAGTVQTIIVYGLNIISAKWFLPLTFLITSIASTAIGSSWAIIGTIGIALMAIGTGLGIDVKIVCGAIMSGCLLGNTISPLGDNANIVSAAVEVNLFEHIKSTLYAVIPGAIICFLIYLTIGLNIEVSAIDQKILDMTINGLDDNFLIHPILLIPVLVILYCSIKKVPSIPSLLLVTGVACLLGYIFQGLSIKNLYEIIYSGYKGNTGIVEIDNMLTRGGVEDMIYNTTVAFSALSLSGILEEAKMLDGIINSLKRFLNTRFSLNLTTMLVSILTMVAMANQFMALIMPGRMFKKTYEKKGYDLTNLTRALATSGGLFDGIVPWGLTGVFVNTVLGVTAYEYMGYTFIVFIVPIITIFYGFTGKFYSEIGGFCEREN